MVAGFSTASCVGHFVIFTIPTPGVAYDGASDSASDGASDGACPSVLGIFCRSLVASLNYPGTITLSRLQRTIVSVLVRLYSRFQQNGTTLVNTCR